jgi:hypothetical protein
MANASNKNPDVENAEHEKDKKVESDAKTEKEVSRKELEDLKTDVDKLSTELDTAVVDLKKSVVDIRSAVSEIENPFNLLRVIQSEKDLKKLNNQRMPPGVRSISIGKPEITASQEDITSPQEEKSQKEESEEVVETPVHSEQEKPLEPRSEAKSTIVEETQPQSQTPPRSQSNLRKSASDYLDWIWSHLDSGLSSDDILLLAKSYEFLGYLPEKSSECIHSLALAAEKMKSVGFKKNHMLLSMYRAAQVSGVQIEIDDVNELISMAQSKVRQSRPSTGPRNK